MAPRGEGIGLGSLNLFLALLRHSWRWMILLGPWSVDQRQGLLCLIATVDPQDHGPGAPIIGPRVSDHGLLVLGP